MTVHSSLIRYTSFAHNHQGIHVHSEQFLPKQENTYKYKMHCAASNLACNWEYLSVDVAAFG